LIVQEAAGRITGMDGAPFDPAAGHLVASNDRLHEQMLSVIREFRARGGDRSPKRTN
jgi:fructose-1,6-bisphosphatase/inositol monophosphatase family enzyme